MIISLPFEEEAVKELKRTLKIPDNLPHCIEVNLWHHKNTEKPKVEFKISIFTSEGRCIQGYGANFAIAKKKIRVALLAESHTLEPDEEVRIITPEPDKVED